MNRTGKIPESDPALRIAARARLSAKRARQTGWVRRTAEEMLHELQVHQIELEIQNEALRESQLALIESRDRYVDFYDFLPVGYLTLDATGLIDEINLTGAQMLGKERGKLLKRRFSSLLVPENVDPWHRKFMNALKAETRLDCEVALLRADGSRLDVRLDCLRLSGVRPGLRVVLTDISERIQAEGQLRDMATDLEHQVLERTSALRRLAAQLTMTEERERRLLAQDLHDNLGQLLAIIRIKLSMLAAGSDPADLARQIADLVGQAERSARAVTMELSPPILHTLGLVPALEWLSEETERVYGVMVDLDTDLCPQALGSEVQAMLYRSTRELLINVAKHAQVKVASVSCLCDQGQLMLVVSDDGRGFDPPEDGGIMCGQHSFGLSSIHERIVNIGGTMEVDSSPGSGTTITLSMPCSIAGKEDCHDSNSDRR